MIQGQASGMSHPADKYYKERSGPYAKVRVCLLCGHSEIVRKGIRDAGRGYGMREGNKARGRMIQHIKAEHPEVLRQAESGQTHRPGRGGRS